jgi:FHA domain/Double zinc ribbon
MQCPNCQHWNEDGSRFCEECGFELKEESRASASVSLRPAGPSAMPKIDLPEPPPQTLIPIDAPPAAPYAGPRLVLNSTGSIFKLGDAALIGREDASLHIDFDGYPEGKYISHRHAQVIKMNGKYYLEDLGSSNHTYVNDIKLAEGQAEPLQEGDKVRFGKIELTFHES